MIFYRANVCCIDPSPEKNSGGERMIGYDELSIGRVLGRGGFGEVYQGTWRMTDVAVKVLLLGQLTNDARKEFEAEAQIMRKLRHPNIVLYFTEALHCDGVYATGIAAPATAR